MQYQGQNNGVRDCRDLMNKSTDVYNINTSPSAQNDQLLYTKRGVWKTQWIDISV